jgi:hypothetical protein
VGEERRGTTRSRTDPASRTRTEGRGHFRAERTQIDPDRTRASLRPHAGRSVTPGTIEARGRERGERGGPSPSARDALDRRVDRDWPLEMHGARHSASQSVSSGGRWRPRSTSSPRAGERIRTRPRPSPSATRSARRSKAPSATRRYRLRGRMPSTMHVEWPITIHAPPVQRAPRPTSSFAPACVDRSRRDGASRVWAKRGAGAVRVDSTAPCAKMAAARGARR